MSELRIPFYRNSPQSYERTNDSLVHYTASQFAIYHFPKFVADGRITERQMEEEITRRLEAMEKKENENS